MAKYRVDTDSGSYMVETEDAPGATASASGTPNPAASPQAAPASPQPQHGLLYNMADSVLNSKPSHSGNDILDAIDNVAQTPMRIMQGVGKGALSTAAGLGDVYNKATGSNQPFNQKNLSGLTDSQNFAQGLGKVGEQVGEYALTDGLGTAAKLGANAAIAGAQSGGNPLATAVGAVLPAVSPLLANAAGKFLSEGLGITTGAGAKAIQRAFSNPGSSDLIGAMKGTITPENVVNNVIGSVEDYAQNASRDYASALNSTVKKANISDWTDKASGFMKNINEKLDSKLQDFNVVKESKLANMQNEAAQSVANKAYSSLNSTEKQAADEVVQKKVWDLMEREPNGRFLRKKIPGSDSTVGSGAATATETVVPANDTQLNMRHVPNEAGLKEGIQSLHDTITNWGNEARDLTPAGLDVLKKNISPYVSAGGRLGAFAKSLYETAKNGLNDIIPDYEKMTGDYAKAQDNLDQIKSALSVKKDGSTNTHAAMSKIQYLLKQPTDFREMIVNKLPNGQQLLDQIAGLHLHDVAPRGLIGRLMAGGEGVAAMMHPGTIPAMAAGAVASSPRIVGNAARLAGKTSGILPVIPKLATAGTAAIDRNQQ